MALVATRLGVPARVVVGARVPEDGVVKGNDVVAWVELRIRDDGRVVARACPAATYMSFRPPTPHDPPTIPSVVPPAPKPQPNPAPPPARRRTPSPTSSRRTSSTASRRVVVALAAAPVPARSRRRPGVQAAPPYRAAGAPRAVAPLRRGLAGAGRHSPRPRARRARAPAPARPGGRPRPIRRTSLAPPTTRSSAPRAPTPEQPRPTGSSDARRPRPPRRPASPGGGGWLAPFNLASLRRP